MISKSSSTTPPNPEEESWVTSDQTQFAAEEPLFERVGLSTDDKNVVSTFKQWPARKKGLVIGGIVVVAVIFLMLLLMRRPLPNELLLPTPSPSPSSLVNDPVQQKIEALRTELKAADPAQQELPFPLVNLDIRLDAKER